MKAKFFFTSLVLSLLFLNNVSNAQQNTCPPPTGITVSNITQHSALVSWNLMPGTAVYNVRYRPMPAQPNTNWLLATTQNDSIHLNNLLANTWYQYQVQSGCMGLNGAITFGAYSPVDSFLTLPQAYVCPIPTNRHVTNITPTTAKLNWDSMGVTAYNVRYRKLNTNAWTKLYAGNNYKNLSGLIPASAYEWQVRSVCTNNLGAVVKSNWSASHIFQTPGATNCPTPTNLTNTYSPNGAVLQWNSTNAMSYNIRYKPANTATWTNTTSTTNHKTIPGLTSGVVYEWQVQSVCGVLGAVVLSPWSASAFFTAQKPIKVNPNPVSHMLNLNYESAKAEEVTLTLRDVYGTIWFTQKLNAQEGTTSLQKDVSELKNGLYYLEITNGETSSTEKIFIQH